MKEHFIFTLSVFSKSIVCSTLQTSCVSGSQILHGPVTHHWVDVEWRPWGVVVGAEPRKRPSLRWAAGCASRCRASLSPPSLTSLLRAEAVWWRNVCWWVRVLRAEGLVVVVTMVSLLSRVMVDAWSSNHTASTAWQRRWRGGGGRGEEDSPAQFTVMGLRVRITSLVILSLFWQNPWGSVCILEHASGAEWGAVDGTSSACWSCQKRVVVWRRRWRSTIMVLRMRTSINQPWIS